MSICRFCLAQKPRRNITELNIMIEDESKSYMDIILFCLGTQVDENSIISTKLCVKCYKSTLEFYQFKTKALKSEHYLKSLGDKPAPVNSKSEVHKEQVRKIEVLKDPISKSANDNDLIKTEPNDAIEIDNDCDDYNEFEIQVKYDQNEVEIKNEPKLENGSDDELLSVIKKIKYEFIEEKDENDAPVQKRKSRQRKPKIYKIKIPKSKEVYNAGVICETCGKNVKDIKSHRNIHLPPEERLRFTCEICEKTFASLHSKWQHKRRKHYAKKKECPDCHKMVMNLSVHRKMHNPDALKFECAPCGRRFVSKARLELHVSVHTKDKPFECHICQKKFRLKVCMNMHIRQVHEKEKTHMCQYCSKSFFKKDHLQVHLRTHTKEKPHGCSVCGKFFRAMTTLNSHMLIHTDDKKYACSLCDMTFVKLNYLNAHMLSHTKEKRYPCQYCKVRFHRSDHRKRHEFTAHLKHTSASPSLLN